MSENDKYPSDPASGSTTSFPSKAEGNDLERMKRLAREIAYQTPEVRADKVVRLKEAIEQGTYQFAMEKLAEILTEELLASSITDPKPRIILKKTIINVYPLRRLHPNQA